MSYFEPATTARKGRSGAHDAFEVHDLLLQQKAGAGRQMPGDVVGGGMGLPRAEGVVHIDVGQAGKLEREALPEFALGLFAPEPPRIRKIDPADLPLPQVPAPQG